MPMFFNVRALSIRQPYAELILRGIKTVEYRTRPTRIIGERFHIYAAKGSAVGGRGLAKAVWSRDLSGRGEPPAWMIELAEQVGSSGTVLKRLLRSALQAGRRARAETEIGEGAVSLGYAVVELARHIFAGVDGCSCLILGGGETAMMAARMCSCTSPRSSRRA